MKHLKVSHSGKVAVILTREAIKSQRLVYIACTNRPVKYRRGSMKSKIVYIGQTSEGINRITKSAAERSYFLRNHAIKELKFYVVTCRRKQKVRTPKELETAFLHTFQSMYGEKPKCNIHEGKYFPEYFDKKRIEEIIEHYSNV